MVFRKGHHPEGLGSDHQDAGHEEVVIVVLTGAPNLLLEALTLNGGRVEKLNRSGSSLVENCIKITCNPGAP